MHNHAPDNYKCPLCISISGIESEDTMMMQDDIFYKDDLVSAAINSKFVGNNPGHVIIFPNVHYENFYDMPAEVDQQIMKIAKRVAVALKDLRKCEGITLQQNNEPDGGQHALHYHMHIFPRYKDDKLLENMSNVRISLPSERLDYANELVEYFEKNGS
ncbi:MAG: HIT family protein [Microgenomates group bacterium]|jgi:histidine triad (HIT) family protein|nr:HIT family protein [Candidatus Woesebacteria bacterium]MBP6883277.1 HIT family protein [Candidatus Woesebacteria bacterium]QQR64159.1 MAG: HIT family protein [Candidatus Roizmanbacteria bacterium]